MLRPYWMPALPLHYRSSSMTEMPDKNILRTEVRRTLVFVKCSTPLYVWREECASDLHLLDTWAPMGSNTRTLVLYDQIQQTVQRTMADSSGSTVYDNAHDGRSAALASLPLLFPLGSMSVGWQWRGDSGDDYMNYTLESEKTVNRMRLLIIRKQGILTLHMQSRARHNNDECQTLRCFREGCMVFCPNRGIVLESRVRERIIDGVGAAAKSLIGMENQVVERLVPPDPASITGSKEGGVYEVGVSTIEP